MPRSSSSPCSTRPRSTGLTRCCVALVLPLILAGCASLNPPGPGTPESAVLRDWGPPTARHTLPDGLQRLEYASGPWGRTTWMLDLDGSGRVTQARQVLTEAELLAVQAATGLHQDALLRWLGTPGERRHGGRAGGEVWSWRYATNDCLWFQSSVAPDGRVTGSAFAIDPSCDAASDRD